MKMTPIALSEARMRFEKMLVTSGYSMTGLWAEKPYKDEKIYVSSMALTNLSDVRGVLWYKENNWQAMLSVRVGEDGEFPLAGGKILRRKTQPWKLKSMSSMVKRIEEIRVQVRRWDSTPTNSLGYVAMIQLAIEYIRVNKVDKAKSILLGAVRGEISQATVSEALSITQMNWCRSREDRLRSSLIWSDTFK